MNWSNLWDKNRQLILLTVFINLVVTGLVLAILGSNLGLYAPARRSTAPDEMPGRQQSAPPLLDEEAAIVDIVEQANPAVVSIVITKDVPVLEQYFENPFKDFFGGEFQPFNFQFPRFRENGTEEKEVGGGSGFLVSADGLVLTNRHVVADDDAAYTVFTNDGEKYEAEVVAKDPFLDIAILRIKTLGQPFPYLSFGRSGDLRLGQTVVAIGNALGEFRNSVSVGVVSGLARSIVASDGRGQSEALEEVIQTDAAINPGNSGGPLLNLSGQVVGVNVAVVLGSENIGFALPADLVAGVVTSVAEHGEIVRPYLGVRYVAITEPLKEKNNLPFDYGVLVSRGETSEDLAVMPGSPADKAGLMENDIILAVDGVKPDTQHSLASLIRQKAVGQVVNLRLWHRGDEKTVPVKLEKAPANL